MRSLVLVVMICGLMPVAALYPHVGILVWGWLTIMQPHREVWDLPPWLALNLFVALLTIVVWIVSREPKLPRFSALPILLGVFFLLMVLSQIYSLQPQHSWTYFNEDIRVMAFVWMTLVLSRNKVRIHAMIWILAVSIGFYGAIGGAFTIATGGNYLVMGPAKSMIGDNNHLGLALCTVIPLCNYLRLQSRSRLIRVGLIVSMALSTVAIFGTHSRGAIIAFVALALLFVVKTGVKFGGALVLSVAVLGFFFMPENWHQRLSTILEFREAESFQSRVDSWTVAWEVAKANPLFGVGLRAHYLQTVIDPFLSEPRIAMASHSIYFELLAGMGFVALGVFVAIVLVTWRDLRWLRRASSPNPKLAWARDLATMFQISLLAFLIGGTALSMEFWEGFWLVVVLTNCARGVIEHAVVSHDATVEVAAASDRLSIAGVRGPGQSSQPEPFRH